MHPKIGLRLGGIGAAGIGLACLAVGAFTGSGPAKLQYQITTKPTVMTVAYKAYGREDAADGKYWLARLVMKNTGESPLTELAVSYRIPDFIDWTTPRSTPEVLPGQTAVMPIYPKLPTRVTNIRSRTPSSIEFKLSWTEADGTRKEKIESREFEFRGVTEIEYTDLPSDELLSWHDMYANAELCAAYITDEDPVVRQYMGEISETMGGFPIPSDAKELAKIMASIYSYQVATGLKYTGNKGVPERLGDAVSTVQSVRLPRDVVYQNSGLCIELAMLWAALGQGAGAKAYLALVPGHCYPVLVANDGSILPIESTGVGGSNVGGTMSFEQAIEVGTKQFNDLMQGKNPGVLIDVVMHQGRGIRPPEFEQVNIADLARLLDERTAKAVNEMRNAAQNQQGPDQQYQQQPEQQAIAGQWQKFQIPGVNVSIPYPADYVSNQEQVMAIQPYLPSIQFIASGPVEGQGFEVYATAYETGPQLVASCRMFASEMGYNLNVSNGEPVTIGGQSGFVHPYSMQIDGVSVRGGFYVYSTNQGTIAFAISSLDDSWRQLGNQIANAVSFGR